MSLDLEQKEMLPWAGIELAQFCNRGILSSSQTSCKATTKGFVKNTIGR